MNDKIKHFFVCLAITLFNAEIAIFGYSLLLKGWQLAAIAGVGKDVFNVPVCVTQFGEEPIEAEW